MSAVRVVVVDDQTLVRRGIRSLLDLAPGIEAVGEASDGAEAITLVDEVTPDVVLLDLRMPGTDGIAYLKLMSDRESPPALVLTTFDDDDQLRAALRAGARGYLLKDVSLETLSAAIRALAGGGTYLHPAVTERLLTLTPAPTPPVAPRGDLTAREREVLRLVAQGLTNREIGEVLSIAEGTVKNHVSSALRTLGTADRTKAVLRALNEGLLDDR